MTTYEYPGYEADKALTQSVVARIERVSAMLAKMIDDLRGIDVEASGGDGDVVLAVNYEGQLTSLSLAQGCTTRYTAGGLSELINTTLEEAVEAAAAETAMVTDVEDEDALQCAVDDLADPDSAIWAESR
jgi:YbaB/EbfC DNA-binding family